MGHRERLMAHNGAPRVLLKYKKNYKSLWDYIEKLGAAVPNSAYFAYRAAHYRRLAAVASNEKIAAAQLALANMFLQMSGDLQRIELTAAQLAEEAAKKAA